MVDRLYRREICSALVALTVSVLASVLLVETLPVGQFPVDPTTTLSAKHSPDEPRPVETLLAEELPVNSPEAAVVSSGRWTLDGQWTNVAPEPTVPAGFGFWSEEEEKQAGGDRFVRQAGHRGVHPWSTTDRFYRELLTRIERLNAEQLTGNRLPTWMIPSLVVGSVAILVLVIIGATLVILRHQRRRRLVIRSKKQPKSKKFKSSPVKKKKMSKEDSERTAKADEKSKKKKASPVSDSKKKSPVADSKKKSAKDSTKKSPKDSKKKTAEDSKKKSPVDDSKKKKKSPVDDSKKKKSPVDDSKKKSPVDDSKKRTKSPTDDSKKISLIEGSTMKSRVDESMSRKSAKSSKKKSPVKPKACKIVKKKAAPSKRKPKK